MFWRRNEPAALKLKEARAKLRRERFGREMYGHLIQRHISGKPQPRPDFDFEIEQVRVDGLAFALPVDSQVGNRYLGVLEEDGNLRGDAFIRHQFASGGALLDIEAGVGFCSVPHAITRDFHPIIALEPDAENFSCLEWNLKAHGIGNVICKCTNIEAVSVDEMASGIERVSFVRVGGRNLESASLSGAKTLLEKRHAAWQFENFEKNHPNRSNFDFIIKAILEYFKYFTDLKERPPNIYSIDEFSDYTNSLKKYANLIFIP